MKELMCYSSHFVGNIWTKFCGKYFYQILCYSSPACTFLTGSHVLNVHMTLFDQFQSMALLTQEIV